MPRVRKPIIDVEVHNFVKRTYKIPLEVARLVEEYAKFLSSRKGENVDADLVIAELGKKLKADGIFTDWLSSQIKSPRKEVQNGTQPRI